MKLCIIPAGGESKRWTAPYPKHLASIGSTTVIQRLVAQLAPHYDRVEILAWHPAIRELYAQAWMPVICHSKYASMYNTRQLWQERTTIVYGDVVLSEFAAQLIVECDMPIRFYGNDNEIFAYSWDATMNERMGEAMRVAMGWADDRWGGYRAFWGKPMSRAGVYDHDRGALCFTHINDWTDDIDTVQEYKALVRKMGAAGV